MARSSQVPEFGQWDGGEDVQYTAYFDKATKAKSKRLKPNDPSLHREEISETVISDNVQHKTREGVDVRRETESPLHRDALELRGRDYDGLKTAKSQDQQQASSRSKHTQEVLNLEEDGSMKKHLDSHLEHQTRGQRQGNTASSSSSITAVPSSPLRDRRRGSSSPKGGIHDVTASLTPGRSRQRSVPHGNETADQSATIPKFGDWDETDPSASENYSNIFTIIRDERRTVDGNMPLGTNISTNRSAPQNSKKCCCFPWRK